MAPRIEQDGSGVRSAVGDTTTALENVTGGTLPTLPGADPRLTTAYGDSEQQNLLLKQKTGNGVDTGGQWSNTLTGIDGETAGDINGLGGSGQGGDASSMMGTALSSLGQVASGLAGAVSSIGSAGSGASMPSMPTVPGATAGQSTPNSLSSPEVKQAIAKLLGEDSSTGSGTGAVGSGSGTGLSTASGGSGTNGPTSAGGTEYEKKIIDLANQVVAANIPYAWGGGTLDGVGQGITDGGVADAAGDYNKTGFDCSGLTRYLVYQASGVEIPRVSGDQYAAGQLISAADARPGDLAFNDNPGQHVMMYVGDGKIVEAQQSGTTIMFGDAASRGVTQYVRVVASA